MTRWRRKEKTWGKSNSRTLDNAISLFVDDLPQDMAWIGSSSFSSLRDKLLIFLFLISCEGILIAALVL